MMSWNWNRLFMLNRRHFALLIALAFSGAGRALADDDDSGGDDGGGDDSGGSGGDNGSGGGAGPSNNGSGSGQSGDNQSKARDAVKEGRAAPLSDVLRVIKAKYKGDVVGAKLRGDAGRLTYRIKMLCDDGKLRVIDADAKTKRIIKVSGG
jgi:hypothetical protein